MYRKKKLFHIVPLTLFLVMLIIGRTLLGVFVYYIILHVRSAIKAPEVPLVSQRGSHVAIVLALEPHKR